MWLSQSTGGLQQRDGGQSSTLAGSTGAETDDAVSGACSLNYEHVSEGYGVPFAGLGVRSKRQRAEGREEGGEGGERERDRDRDRDRQRER